MADYENQDAGYDGELTIERERGLWTRERGANSRAEGRSYDRRDRSASPRGDREDRQRSRSPNGRAPYVNATILCAGYH